MALSIGDLRRVNRKYLRRTSRYAHVGVSGTGIPTYSCPWDQAVDILGRRSAWARVTGAASTASFTGTRWNPAVGADVAVALGSVTVYPVLVFDIDSQTEIADTYPESHLLPWSLRPDGMPWYPNGSGGAAYPDPECEYVVESYDSDRLPQAVVDLGRAYEIGAGG